MTVYPSSNDNHPTLAQAIADARAGRRDEAARRLRQIVSDDPGNVDAWIWLGGTASDANEQRRALERALALAPNNARAQQGLDWLRRTAPQAFAVPRTDPPPAEPRRVPLDAATPRFNTMDAVAQRAAAPTQVIDRGTSTAQEQASPSVHEQPTQAMPSVRTDPPTQVMPQYQPPVGPPPAARRPDPPLVQVRPAPLPRTEALPGAPAPVRVPQDRAIIANIARWALLIPIWAIGLGAALITTAFVIWTLLSDPPFLDRLAASAFRPFGLLLQLGSSGRFGLLAGLFVVVVLDTLVVLGLLIGRMWAWRIAFAVALLTFIGAAVLAVLPWVVPGLAFNPTVTDPRTQILWGLVGFTLGLFLITIASRRAFRRRAPEGSLDER